MDYLSLVERSCKSDLMTLITGEETARSKREVTLAKVALLVVHKERRWVMFVCCGMMGSDRVSTITRSTLAYGRVNPYQQTS